MHTEKLLKNFNIQKDPDVSKIVKFGLGVLIICIGGFLLWAFITPLDSSAIAPGKITVSSHRKTIKHLEGGIVEKIFIKEGDFVKKGDPLIKLQETQPGTTLDLLTGQLASLLAQEARLISERDDKDKVEFPAMLVAQSDNIKIKEIIQGQLSLFKVRKTAHLSTINVLEKRVEQLDDEVESLQSKVLSFKKQLQLINEEAEAVEILEKKKLIERPRLLALLRARAQLEGNRDENVALIARTKQKIGETKLQIINQNDTRRKEVLEKLNEVQEQLLSVREKQKAASDVFARTLIVAPQDGRIVDLKVHTVNGVISPREPLMDIVPKNDELIITARVNPIDIDVVHVDLDAKIQLLPYKQRHMPILDGKVTQVSADSFEEERTGRTFYKIQVVIDKVDLSKIENVKLYPGMPVQVMVITGRQTPFDYFITPIKDSFTRAFRED